MITEKEKGWRRGSRGRWRRKVTEENGPNEHPLALSKSMVLPLCHPLLLGNSKEGPWPILEYPAGSKKPDRNLCCAISFTSPFREGEADSWAGELWGPRALGSSGEMEYSTVSPTLYTCQNLLIYIFKTSNLFLCDLLLPEAVLIKVYLWTIWEMG